MVRRKSLGGFFIQYSVVCSGRGLKSMSELDRFCHCGACFDVGRDPVLDVESDCPRVGGGDASGDPPDYAIRLPLGSAAVMEHASAHHPRRGQRPGWASRCCHASLSGSPPTERRRRSSSFSPLPSTKLRSFVLRCVTRPAFAFRRQLNACGLALPRGTILQYRWAGGLLSPPYTTIDRVWHT